MENLRCFIRLFVAVGAVHASVATIGVTVNGADIGAKSGGAGIGGGYRGTVGTLVVRGGTVFATRGGGQDIGSGNGASAFGTNTFTGGSIFLAYGSISNLPVNAALAPVRCVTVPGFAPGARCEVTGLPADYGVNDLFADAGGRLYLWLPAGEQTLFGVSDGSATNTVLAITVFSPETGVTAWTPSILPEAHVETLYSTDLTSGEWSLTPPETDAPTVFMKLRVK